VARELLLDTSGLVGLRDRSQKHPPSVPSTEISLLRCRDLIKKYDDLPMDFADATLVVLAEELNTDIIFTVDSDFEVYRIRGRKRFRLFPAQQ